MRRMFSENQIKEMLDSELKLPTDLEEKYILDAIKLARD